MLMLNFKLLSIELNRTDRAKATIEWWIEIKKLKKYSYPNQSIYIYWNQLARVFDWFDSQSSQFDRKINT